MRPTGSPPVIRRRAGAGTARWGRRAILVLALAAGAAGLPAAAAAQEPASPPGIGFSEKRAKARGEEPAKRWGDGRTSRGPQPIAEPAKGSPYNLTHIVYASLIMLAMLGLVVWLVRRNRRS